MNIELKKNREYEFLEETDYEIENILKFRLIEGDFNSVETVLKQLGISDFYLYLNEPKLDELLPNNIQDTGIEIDQQIENNHSDFNADFDNNNILNIYDEDDNDNLNLNKFNSDLKENEEVYDMLNFETNNIEENYKENNIILSDINVNEEDNKIATINYDSEINAISNNNSNSLLLNHISASVDDNALNSSIKRLTSFNDLNIDSNLYLNNSIPNSNPNINSDYSILNTNITNNNQESYATPLTKKGSLEIKRLTSKEELNLVSSAINKAGISTQKIEKDTKEDNIKDNQNTKTTPRVTRSVKNNNNIDIDNSLASQNSFNSNIELVKNKSSFESDPILTKKRTRETKEVKEAESDNSKVEQKNNIKSDKKTNLGKKTRIKLAFVEKPDIKDRRTYGSLFESADDRDLEFDVLVANKLSKNIKILSAIIRRVPIVNFKWYEKCMNEKQTLETEKYIVRDTAFENKYNFNLQTVLEMQPYKYMNGYSFYLSDHLDVDIDMLSFLIKTAGGNVTEKYELRTDYLIILDKVHDKTLIGSLKKKKGYTFNLNLILDSVFQSDFDFNNKKYQQ